MNISYIRRFQTKPWHNFANTSQKEHHENRSRTRFNSFVWITGNSRKWLLTDYTRKRTSKILFICMYAFLSQTCQTCPTCDPQAGCPPCGCPCYVGNTKYMPKGHPLQSTQAGCPDCLPVPTNDCESSRVRFKCAPIESSAAQCSPDKAATYDKVLDWQRPYTQRVMLIGPIK